jgi:hypothetical protein
MHARAKSEAVSTIRPSLPERYGVAVSSVAASTPDSKDLA